MLEMSSWVSGLIVGAGLAGAVVVAPGDGDMGRDGEDGVVWANAAPLSSAKAATAIGMVRITGLQFPYKLTCQHGPSMAVPMSLTLGATWEPLSTARVGR